MGRPGAGHQGFEGAAPQRARSAAPGPALAAAVALAALTSCGPGPADPGLPGPTFTVGDLTFRVASAGVVKGAGELTFWLTDAPSTCAAIAATPVQATTFFSLRVAPAAGGATTALVVPTTQFPAPGEAVARLERRTGGVLGPGYDGASGAVAWSVDAAGALTLTSFEVAFAGATGTMAGGGLRLAACN
jgi:hypothetical protein